MSGQIENNNMLSCLFYRLCSSITMVPSLGTQDTIYGQTLIGSEVLGFDDQLSTLVVPNPGLLHYAHRFR